MASICGTCKQHPKTTEIELGYHSSLIKFLDTLVRLKDGRKETDLYSKPGDKHLKPQSKSSHPPLTKKLYHMALVYGSRGYARTMMTTRPGGRN